MQYSCEKLNHHYKRKPIAPAVRDFHSKYKGEVL